MNSIPTKIPGIQPLTVVDEDATISIEALAKRVQYTRETHGEVLQKYHEIWYNAPHTWHYTHFLGIGLMKCPNDLWIYQALINDLKPRTIIETGTYHGASALWFAFLMEMLNIDDGRVFTIDFEDRVRCGHPRITFLGGDSTDPKLAEAIREQIKYPLLISLDADHSAEHVRKELELYAPMCRIGDYLVVEDTNIAWLSDDQGKGGDRGARGGVEDYMTNHQGEWYQDPICERYLLTMNPGGWLKRIAECVHEKE